MSEPYGIIVSIPVDEHGLPDEKKMAAQGRRAMYNYGRRLAAIRETMALDAICEEPRSQSQVAHALFPLHFDADGETIYVLYCTGPCCIDPPPDTISIGDKVLRVKSWKFTPPEDS